MILKPPALSDPSFDRGDPLAAASRRIENVTLAASFAQLTLRLAFGMAAALSTLSAKDVSAPFFRVQLWVVMGLNTFAALLLARGEDRIVTGLVIMAAVLSYFTSVLWLYDAKSSGKVGLILVGFGDWIACAKLAQWLGPFDMTCSGLVLGFAVTAMLLGHWYLNTPSMNIAPLRQLILLLMAAVLVRIAGELASGRMSLEFLGQVPVAWLTLRWLAGMVGPVVVGLMVWQTLKIPNTQSATGLLYVVVMLVFLGESISVFWTT